MTLAYATAKFVSPRAPSAFAAKLATFAPLADGDLTAIASLTLPVRNVRVHMSLVRPEDDLRGTLVVLSGFACCYRQHADGKRQNLSYMLPGDCFELDRLNPDGLAALSACTVVLIGSGTLRAVLENYPQLADAISVAARVRDAISREWLVNLGSRTAIQRIAHLFCELLARLETVRLVTDDSYSFPVSQAELSATVGLSPVHVNRTLQELRRAGLIELKCRTLHVTDRARLQALSGFNPDYLFARE